MLKFAKVINEEKQCEVGLGTDEGFYQSIGMTEQDVEQAWDGAWYLSGYAPEKPQEIIKQERITELKQLLADSDYWGRKYLEGEYTEEEWEAKKAQSKAWRKELRELQQ